jgi:hypothetical protein
MNKNLIFVMMSMILLITTPFLTSCNNDETFTAPVSGVEGSKGSSARITPLGNYTMYEVDPTIMAYFQHFYQQGPDTGTIGGHACGPASYMMSVRCLAGYKDRPYKVQYVMDAAKQSYIYTEIKKNNGNNPIKTTDLTAFGNNVKYDGNWISCEDKYTSDRDVMKTFIQQALTNNKFVVVAINAYDFDPKYPKNPNLYNNDPSNYDLSATGEVSTGSYNWNYISTLDESPENSTNKLIGGHIIVIVRLRVNLDGTGVVEYVDPLADNHNPSNRKYVSYTRLLNSMAINGTYNSQYDAMSIALK